MSGFLVPVLYWKPGIATVPVFEFSFVPDGGASPHSSVRRPFEVLDQTAPLATPVLRTLLPRFPRLEHYACAYRFPPRDVDQFVDEFPRGLSHLLAVSLALYALGADHTVGGSRFRDRLAGWTAVGHPTKTGGVEASDHVRAKLDALARERDELAGTGVTVTDVLLPAAKAPESAFEPQESGLALLARDFIDRTGVPDPVPQFSKLIEALEKRLFALVRRLEPTP